MAVVCVSGSLGVSACAAYLIPMGTAVGIEVDVDGVLVERIGDVETADGTVTPGKAAGLELGDVIQSVDGKAVKNLEDFSAISPTFDGRPLELTVSRKGKAVTCTITPACNSEGSYQLGLWLRDLVAGVGTVTYYNPKTGEYGALGHGINDPDSGALVPITGGQTFDATVVGVVRGQKGDPGELTGSFDNGHVFGDVDSNTVFGIFGVTGASVTGEGMETAAPGEAKTGPAEILSTVAGSEPVTYDIRIDKVQQKDGAERYQITVTDPDLLNITGGVVCGMSGSPIIQNGKLVGAVTHVLVNEPTRGYGLHIDAMLEAA